MRGLWLRTVSNRRRNACRLKQSRSNFYKSPDGPRIVRVRLPNQLWTADEGAATLPCFNEAVPVAIRDDRLRHGFNV
jgi:hypothetical protein